METKKEQIKEIADKVEWIKKKEVIKLIDGLTWHCKYYPNCNKVCVKLDVEKYLNQKLKDEAGYVSGVRKRGTLKIRK